MAERAAKRLLLLVVIQYCCTVVLRYGFLSCKEAYYQPSTVVLLCTEVCSGVDGRAALLFFLSPFFSLLRLPIFIYTHTTTAAAAAAESRHDARPINKLTGLDRTHTHTRSLSLHHLKILNGEKRGEESKENGRAQSFDAHYFIFLSPSLRSALLLSFFFCLKGTSVERRREIFPSPFQLPIF